MEQSLFIKYVDKWFGPIVTKLVEKLNGKEGQQTYLHRRMLRKVFSPTLKWGSLSSNGTIVAADIVAMDTSLPLKKRDAIKKAEGDIPKQGMKLYLNERTMSDLDILEAQNTNGDRTKQIIQMLFADAKKCIMGIDEQNEFMFLQALSTGLTVISDPDNPGVGVRFDFGHPDANKFGATTAKWSGTDATPIDDIENVVQRASENGHTITKLMMDRAAFNNMRKNTQVKELFAAGIGIVGSSVPQPTLAQLNDVMDSNYGVTIELVDRNITFEKSDGTRTSVKPWANNTVVFLTSDMVGDLVWGRLAEMNHPAKQVAYQVVDDFKLISKYHKNDPLQEFTSSQALVLPVINGIESIYILDTEEAEEAAQTEGDAVFTYKTVDYTKASVVEGINAANADLNAKETNADSTLQTKINKLSDEEVVVFESKLVESGV